MEDHPAEGPERDPTHQTSHSGDPVEADPNPISGHPRPAVFVAIVAALAVAAVGVLVVVRVAASGDQGTIPAPHVQVVGSSAQSGQDSHTSGDSATPTPDVRSNGSVNVGSSGSETTGPAGLPGDSGELPRG